MEVKKYVCPSCGEDHYFWTSKKITTTPYKIIIVKKCLGCGSLWWTTKKNGVKNKKVIKQ